MITKQGIRGAPRRGVLVVLLVASTFLVCELILPTAEAANRKLELGDIVYRDEDGFLYFVERSNQQIESSGYRIAPSEFEEVTIESGLIESAAAVGTPDEDSGEKICVAVMPATVYEDIEFAIRHVCARELLPHMQPSETLISGGIPLTANGKPDRSAVVELFRNQSKNVD